MLLHYHKPDPILGSVHHYYFRPGSIIVHEVILSQLADCSLYLVKLVLYFVILIYLQVSWPPEKSQNGFMTSVVVSLEFELKPICCYWLRRMEKTG